MRSGLFALRAAGAAAVLVLVATAGPAYAGDGEEPGGKETAKVKATVVPSTVRPGSDVDVRVTGCKGRSGSARSKAFARDAALSGHPDRSKPLLGDTTVRSGASSGTYQVTVHCDGRDHHDVGTLRVVHRPPATPVAPVRAGGGGTATLAADAEGADEQGPGTPHTVIGLLLAGVAAVAVAFRSVRRRRSGAD
ncbi:hypothetical protein [Streptomyces sp. SP18CS02]|uniref:hypothetical protein n=1 Tax=Streptomyces sp. SP18CS02 TaxID=3002531 RepID=UPI002E7668D3|nr:hypothetical protein [Streptomyces sp. SP18CS02]MEE1752351.1 hypothetical protein [Streptomyces sp. SP18CS02]